MREKEQRDKFEKYLKRKQIEEENQHHYSPPVSRDKDRGKVYNI